MAGGALPRRQSLPVPVVGFHRARGDHRGYGEADYSPVPAKKRPISGYRLHRPSTHSDPILDFAPVPANRTDGTLTEPRPIARVHRVAVGDQGSSNAPLQGHRAARHDAVLRTPRRKHQRAQLPAALTRAIAHFRQRIETVNRPLAGQLHLQRNHAKRVAGRCARVQAKLAAHTAGLYLNRLLGQQGLALKPLALI